MSEKNVLSMIAPKVLPSDGPATSASIAGIVLRS